MYTPHFIGRHFRWTEARNYAFDEVRGGLRINVAVIYLAIVISMYNSISYPILNRYCNIICQISKPRCTAIILDIVTACPTPIIILSHCVPIYLLFYWLFLSSTELCIYVISVHKIIIIITNNTYLPVNREDKIRVQRYLNSSYFERELTSIFCTQNNDIIILNK